MVYRVMKERKTTDRDDLSMEWWRHKRSQKGIEDGKVLEGYNKHKAFPTDVLTHGLTLNKN